MKYRCCNCGKIFDESDILRIEESRGEYWGIPCTETMYYSPCCKDDYDVAEETGTIKVTDEMREYIRLKNGREPQTNEDAKEIARVFVYDYEMDAYIADAEFVEDDFSEIHYTLKW